MWAFAREYQKKSIKLEEDLVKLRLDRESDAIRFRDEGARDMSEFYKQEHDKMNQLWNLAMSVSEDTIKELRKHVARLEENDECTDD